MRDRIEAAAEANNRSMNAEIIDRIEDSLDQEGPSSRLEDVIHDTVSKTIDAMLHKGWRPPDERDH